jgi:hypothetical protein
MSRSPLAIDPGAARLMRLSVAFLWLATAAASVWEWHGQSTDLLVAAGMSHAAWRDACVLLGAAVDAVLGMLLLAMPGRRTCLAALGAMIAMTAVATFLLPGLWLHPLGPLTKNIPVAAMLWILATNAR